MNILEKILNEKRPEIEALESSIPLGGIIETARSSAPPRGFGHAIRKEGKVSIIAEIKRASPSKGLIRPDLDPPSIAREYEAGGARAISCLTEINFFQGSPEFLAPVREAADIPLLRKDFIVSPHQVPESRILGADALLLIVACLDDALLRDLLALTTELEMDALVEVHTEAELERALTANARIVGINNRNLETFEVDLQTTFTLMRDIPEDRTIVSESGISSRLDIELLRDVGVHAALIGESLMRQNSLTRAVRDLIL